MMRLAVICDFVEENWPSMDLVAEMLLQNLDQHHGETIRATRICPPMKRHFTRIPLAGRLDIAYDAERFTNRFRSYPKMLERNKENFDLFHIVDHSYAHLVHTLPAERTIVTCHDIDTFRCVLEPETESRSRLFVAMTKRILDGLRKAAFVTCDSFATRDELLKHKVVPLNRMVVIPNGVHPTCSHEPVEAADTEAMRLLGPENDGVINLLHVGSTIPRKRIDLLLLVFSEIKKEFPNTRLVRAGGAFTTEQLRLVDRLGLTSSIIVLPVLDRDVLAAVYRRAALVLLPSAREGFGLPVIEAMACGTPVVASDLDVLREVGGDTATYCALGDVPAWTDRCIDLLNERQQHPERWAERRSQCIGQAAKFTWAEYTEKMVELYRAVSAAS